MSHKLRISQARELQKGIMEEYRHVAATVRCNGNWPQEVTRQIEKEYVKQNMK